MVSRAIPKSKSKSLGGIVLGFKVLIWADPEAMLTVEEDVPCSTLEDNQRTENDDDEAGSCDEQILRDGDRYGTLS